MTKNRPAWFLVLCLLLLTASVQAQKVKYKDIFGLLNTRQYEQAEPFLRKYLKTNDDNPNAFLFMGIIYQEKALKMDVLKQTAEVTAQMDSSILFYDKAYKTIDERELRKEKEYYQAYNRRDLRTGEFGVKLSDVQFDIEKKIQGLRERIERVKMVKHYFSLADTAYKTAQSVYAGLRKDYPAGRQLLLRADEQTLARLSRLASAFDSCTNAFANYKTSATQLGRTGYNQNITLVDIKEFGTEGTTSADFFADDLQLWNYKKFAVDSKQVIEKEIMPMRAHLITYDIEINKLRERLNTDSVSVRSDLTRLIDVLLYDQLRKFDPEPLPMQVFAMKTADLEYRSLLMENRALKDSANVHLQLRLLAAEQKSLAKLDSISSRLAKSDIDQKALDYSHFITNTYSNTIVLHSYIKALHEYAEREKRRMDENLAHYNRALEWVIDGTDSIPARIIPHGRFSSLFVADEQFTVGLAFADSVNSEGYIYGITPSRKAEFKVRFPVDKSTFRKKELNAIKALTFADPSGQVFYVLIYSQNPAKDKYPATLAKIYRSDGLAWSNNYAISFIPNALDFKAETSEVTIRDDARQMVIDKNGKVLR